MAKTLVEKFFIKNGYHIAVLNAPENYLSDTLVGLPDDVTVSEALDGQYDLVHVFAAKKETLAPQVESLKAALKTGGMLWISYPKGNNKAKVETDLNRDILNALVSEYGFKANHIISIDDIWSALRFKVDG